MGRTTRFRSTSGGSFCELNNERKASVDIQSATPTTKSNSHDAARRLLEIVLQLRDSRGRGLLHELVTNDNDGSSLLRTAKVLLERASEMTMLSEFLTQPDYESGYTPLHWAILHGSLSVILLLLRVPGSQLERPLPQLLLSNHQDWEGLTPFRLLSQLQVKTLTRIREVALVRPKIIRELSSSMPPGGRTRASSFSVAHHDEPETEDDFSILQQGLGVLESGDDGFSSFSSSQQSENTQKYACEVMTFGAAHHAALGVSDTTKNAHHTNRPRRVLLNHAMAAAVQVAAAAHHTLLLTNQGHVLACGLGKGGRLGTSGQEQSTPIPLRVKGSLAKRQVVFIAAADNHSLCVTKEGGHVYSWGSNRFGQLDGCCSASSNNNATNSFRCLPHRVVDLKKPCVAVAAGERHSVALTCHGEVYTW